MGRMGDAHQDLMSIHQILLGQRKVAYDTALDLKIRGCKVEAIGYDIKVGTINDLLLEFEAAGVVWPDNVVSID
jgi:hypothetical protein